jgi:hypothetical protein
VQPASASGLSHELAMFELSETQGRPCTEPKGQPYCQMLQGQLDCKRRRI